MKNAVLAKQAATAAPIESSARPSVSSSAFLAHLAVATRSAAARPHAAALRRSVTVGSDEKWWPGTESNCRHADFQSSTLCTQEHPGSSNQPVGRKQGLVRCCWVLLGDAGLETKVETCRRNACEPPIPRSVQVDRRGRGRLRSGVRGGGTRFTTTLRCHRRTGRRPRRDFWQGN